jgi:hypothetical protein
VATPAPAPRKIAPNISDPTPLLLGEIFYHLLQGRLLRFASRPFSAAVAAGFLTGGLWLYPSITMAALSGAVLSVTTVWVFYLLWYGRFAFLNSQRLVLCPQCRSRMWQFCCKRCREPVPPLAFMLRGAFLSECPHCGLRLSCQTETLKAWCSTCSHTEPHPELLYGKPTHVMVWAVDKMPTITQAKGGWQLIAKPNDTRMILYHRRDPHSASLMFVVHYVEDDLPFDPHIIKRCRMLLISEGVPTSHVDRFTAKFPSALLERI